jgi:hypothetical protein
MTVQASLGSVEGVDPRVQAAVQTAVNKVFTTIQQGHDAVADKVTGTCSQNGLVVTVSVQYATC